MVKPAAVTVSAVEALDAKIDANWGEYHEASEWTNWTPSDP